MGYKSPLHETVETTATDVCVITSYSIHYTKLYDFFLEILGFTFEMVFTGNGWGKYVLGSEFITNVLFILGFTFLFARFLGLGVITSYSIHYTKLYDVSPHLLNHHEVPICQSRYFLPR